MKPTTIAAVPLPSQDSIAAANRAVIDFSGIDQAGPSYEGRVFLNNPDAHAGTPLTPEEGYAGSFHVYGFGLPAEKSAPDAPPEQASGEKARLPIRKYILATEAVSAAAKQAPHASVTIVPVLPGEKAANSQKPDDRIPLEQVTIHTNTEGSVPASNQNS